MNLMSPQTNRESRCTTPERRRRLTLSYALSPRQPRRILRSLRCLSSSSPERSQSVETSDNGYGSTGEMLSDVQKKLIRRSWKLINSCKPKFSRLLYLEIFRQDPQLRKVFTWEDLTEQQMLDHPSFQRQAMAIVALFDKCINSMDDIKSQETKMELFFVGKRHSRFRGYGFSPAHWEMFRQTIVDSVIDIAKYSTDGRRRGDIAAQFNIAELTEAWEIFTHYIIDCLITGFNSAEPGQFSVAMVDLTNTSLNALRRASKRSTTKSVKLDPRRSPRTTWSIDARAFGGTIPSKSC